MFCMLVLHQFWIRMQFIYFVIFLQPTSILRKFLKNKKIPMCYAVIKVFITLQFLIGNNSTYFHLTAEQIT